MPEKKTFKNATVWPDYNTKGWTVHNEGSFTPKEWDMEVTFTRKPREIQIGDQVTDGYYKMRVVAIEDYQAWCHNYMGIHSGCSENFYSTENLSDLKHAS